MLYLFPRNVLDEIWDLIESVSEDFPTYVCIKSRFKSRDLSINHRNSPKTFTIILQMGSMVVKKERKNKLPLCSYNEIN